MVADNPQNLQMTPLFKVFF